MALSPNQIISRLEPHLSPERIARLNLAVANRSKQVVTVLENPYDPGNVNAAMRSAEAFGFGEFHLIGSPSGAKHTGRTSAGAGKWLEIHNWVSSTDCIDDLKSNGYQIVGTVVDGDTPISKVDFTRPTALVFGSEHAGISAEMRSLLDVRAVLPMDGMVESFNLSVAVAISLFAAHSATSDARQPLSATEQTAILAEFYTRSVPNSQKILESGT